MIATHIETIVTCDQCGTEDVIDSGLCRDARRPDLDIVECRALDECASVGWSIDYEGTHLCPLCNS